MLRQKEKFFSTGLALLFIVATVAVLYFCYVFRIEQWVKPNALPESYYFVMLMIFPTWYVLIKLSGLSRLDRVKPYSIQLFQFAFWVVLGTALLLFYIFVFKLQGISRVVLLLFTAIDFAVLFILKVLALKIMAAMRRKGYNTKYVVIIADKHSEDIIEKIINRHFYGYQIKAIMTDAQNIIDKYQVRYSVLPNTLGLDSFLEIETVDEVIFCCQRYDQEYLKQLVYSCQEVGVTFRFLSLMHQMIKSNSYPGYIDEYPIFTFTKTPTNYIAIQFKRVFDFVSSLFAIMVLSPVLALIAFIIKLDSKGPVLFKQTRVGLRGRLFQVYKFRTMVINAEELKAQLTNENEQGGPVFKMKNDPRITKAGRFLRKTSLDELPQLFNILRGEMSVVGPRPPIPKEVAEYERWQLRRLSMRPGLTCIWQVSGRNNIPFEQWMRLDLQYIDTWSLKLDFIIILKTIKVVLKGDGM
jgi:exopolysaccharide biosynthesis polyprenyl glycosylphosphotransferase